MAVFYLIKKGFTMSDCILVSANTLVDFLDNVYDTRSIGQLYEQYRYRSGDYRCTWTQFEELGLCALENNKVCCIKRVREITQQGLKESKKIVDQSNRWKKVDSPS